MVLKTYKKALNTLAEAKPKYAYLVCAFFLIFMGVSVILTAKDIYNYISWLKSSNEKNIVVKDLRWTYKCEKNKCARKDACETGYIMSLDTCNMVCGSTQIWPRPKNMFANGRLYVGFTSDQLRYSTNVPTEINDIVEEALDIFQENIRSKQRIRKVPSTDIEHFIVKVSIMGKSKDLRLNTDESYSLSLKRNNKHIQALISASNFFGARHGLETLSQLIWWDQDQLNLKVLYDVGIKDEPSFPYRGLMVDTGRNYFTLDSLKRIVKGMAANKLNVFHWHITDAQSFPLESNHTKNFARYGAYHPSKVYTRKVIKDFVEFSRVRGVRVILEVDVPAHVNRGWLWGPKNNLGDLVLCQNSKSLEGVLNVANQHVFELLKGIYSDILELNTNTEIFHIGGSEVNLKCWYDNLMKNSSTDVHELWVEVVNKMLVALENANSKRLPETVILWSSFLTDVTAFQKLKDHSYLAIQQKNSNKRVSTTNKIIFSEEDPLFLDCGLGAWGRHRTASCDKFNTWQNIYLYGPWYGKPEIFEYTLGGEVCLWSELVNEDSIETKIWPRAAAFAERLWYNPDNTYIPEEVFVRIDTQRRRMLERGLKIEALWPLLCTQNPGLCI